MTFSEGGHNTIESGNCEKVLHVWILIISSLQKSCYNWMLWTINVCIIVIGLITIPGLDYQDFNWTINKFLVLHIRCVPLAQLGWVGCW